MTGTKNKTKTVKMTLNQAVRKSKKLRPGEKTVKQLRNMKDEDIDYSDIPELTEAFFANARLLKPTHKRSLSMKIDDDIVNWFQKLGKDYASYINTVLRAYMETQKIIVGHTPRTS